MSLTLGLHSALSGLSVAQKGIDLTSNNIANVNTEGYTKKIFTQESIVVEGRGAGVSTTSYKRNVDESLLKDLLQSGTTLGALSAKNSYLGKLEDYFGDPESNTSVSHYVTNMITAFQSLATDVSDITTQTEAIDAAQQLTERMNALSEQIQSLRLDADKQISEDVDEINSLLEKIDELNDQIVRTDNIGAYSSDDYKDQRDSALNRLGQLIDISYFTRTTGEVVILTTGGKTLLDKDPVTVSHQEASMFSSTTSYSGGTVNGIYAGKYDITTEIKSGEIGGLLEMRDEILPKLQAELDELSSSFITEVNAIHNQGTTYPDTPYAITGTRTFIDTTTNNGTTPAQSISIDDGDVRITLFNDDGSQYATTTLKGDLGFASGVIYDASGHDPDTMCQTIQDWLRDPTGPNLTTATVKVDDNGKLSIDLGNSDYGIGFLDTATSILGSEAQDATIGFDANGDGTNDQTYSGFSSFFGLNDFFIVDSETCYYDSSILSLDYNPHMTTNTTLQFSNAEEGVNFGSVAIYPYDTITSIGNRINSDVSLEDKVKAELVQEGAGYRIRITGENGEQLEITEAVPQTGLLSKLGMEPSEAVAATSFHVRNDIAASPGKVSSGSVLYDSGSGEYFLSSADNSVATKMAEKLSSNITFESAGGITTNTMSFAEYSSSIISKTATLIDNNQSLMDSQSALTDSLTIKAAEISDVNLDEELSQLIVYQQSYSAAAKVISTLVEMLDTLNDMVR